MTRSSRQIRRLLLRLPLVGFVVVVVVAHPPRGDLDKSPT